MSRTIYCKFLKREAEGQNVQVYPGKLGQFIYENISKEAWMQWQNQQTIIINENKLSMINVDDRKKINEAMINFLFKDQDIQLNEIC